MRRKIISVLAFIILHILVISSALSRPSGTVPSVLTGGPIAHFFGFFVISYMTFIMLKSFNAVYPTILSCIYSIALGILIEVLQKSVGYRVFSYEDMLVDALGILAFVLVEKSMRLYYIWERLIPN